MGREHTDRTWDRHRPVGGEQHAGATVGDHCCDRMVSTDARRQGAGARATPRASPRRNLGVAVQPDRCPLLPVVTKLARTYGVCNIAVAHRLEDLTAQADDGSAAAKQGAVLPPSPKPKSCSDSHPHKPPSHNNSSTSPTVNATSLPPSRKDKHSGVSAHTAASSPTNAPPSNTPSATPTPT
jgi:hypothetical protein